MLGRDIVDALHGRDVSAPSRAELDITDRDAVRAAVAGHDVVINAAAFTAVDAAEHDQAAAFAVNATGAGLLAEAAHDAAARFVQVSTDYVFHGDATQPYDETAPLDPVNVYGRSKAEGERLATAATDGELQIVRTAWLYGAHGRNFARTIWAACSEGKELKVVDDQLGQPTWTVDVAQRIVDMLDLGLPRGVYHATSSGEASWFDFARAIAKAAGGDEARVTPIDSAGHERDASRPSYSVLGHHGWESTPLEPIRHWRDALDAAVARGVLEDR